MTVAPHAIPFVLLATPGERLGWIFTDRNLYRRKFMEPSPELAAVPTDLYDQLNQARARLKKRVKSSIRNGIGLAVLIAGAGGIRTPEGGDMSSTFIVLSVIAFAGGFVAAFAASLGPYRAARAIVVAEMKNLADHEEAQDDWKRRQADHEDRQQEMMETMSEWAAAAPSRGSRRIDIIGGTTYGWEAVLTVYGGSLLATRGPMTLVDLTGDALCGELVQLATVTGRSVRRLQLPTELADLDLLAGLSANELVDCLVEAMHGDAEGAARAERSQDYLLLREIGQILGADLTVAKLLAALRVLSDRPDQAALTTDEIARLHDLMPDENRRQLYTQLRRIEGFLFPLEEMGSRVGAATEPADLTCLIADGEGSNVQNDLFKDLLLHWLTRVVRREARPMGSLVVLGADEMHHRSIEKLSTLCDRHGVRLVLFFSHLRAEAVHTIGGGEVALMRLGNHHEANQAAEYIGKGHKFVLSQLTRTTGGNDSHNLTNTHGGGDSHGTSGNMGFGKPGRSRSYGKTAGRSRNWSQAETTSRGTNWNDAAAVQRVHEYTVEPRVLQDLPEYAMVLVRTEDRKAVVQAVEVDPAIVMLPRVSMAPRTPAPLPDPVEAVVPAARPPDLRRPAPDHERGPAR
ncbi:hypothetical protein [Actinoplanes sp. NPDC026619]|uniref:hypothetical protein n=1 Tax=Actinoplanes sp. NPDC026619 TaxID=3155798 RepID=UPI0033E6D823